MRFFRNALTRKRKGPNPPGRKTDSAPVLFYGGACGHMHPQPWMRASHVRVTRNVFRLRERAKPRHMEHWLYVIGDKSGDNRIDHNRFCRKVNSGSPVFIRGDDATLACSERDRVDHSQCCDVVYVNGDDGHETIRTGRGVRRWRHQSSAANACRRWPRCAMRHADWASLRSSLIFNGGGRGAVQDRS